MGPRYDYLALKPRPDQRQHPVSMGPLHQHVQTTVHRFDEDTMLEAAT